MPLIEKIVNFNNRHRLLSHFIFWAFVYLLMLARYYPSSSGYNNFEEPRDPLWVEAVCSVFFTVFSALFAYFFGYRVIPGLMKAKHYLWIILESIVGIYLIAAFSRIMVVHVLEPMVRKRPFAQESISEILTDLPKLFYSYFLQSISLSLIFIFIKMVKDQYVINKHALELRKQKAESELKSLKAQLNPHFLFNTLNNIYSLSLMQSPKTSPSIARLSEILDHLLYRCGDMYVPVSQEVSLLQNYIELEKLRYDERLQVVFRHSMDSDAKIAPLILLSLVENAFKHGAGEFTGNPEIGIDLKVTGGQFSFVVRNSCTQVKQEDEQVRIGLSNIRKQLELLYPGAHRFSTTISHGYFTASLQLDLHQKENN